MKNHRHKIKANVCFFYSMDNVYLGRSKWMYWKVKFKIINAEVIDIKDRLEGLNKDVRALVEAGPPPAQLGQRFADELLRTFNTLREVEVEMQGYVRYYENAPPAR